MKAKRIIAIILSVMMILPVWSQPISLGSVQTADESTANPQSAEDLSLTATFSGSGTEADPYIIATAADFIALTNDMNASTNHNGHYFKQTANIDLAGNADYVGAQAASSSAHTFYGIYNGCGYTINVDLTATDERFIFPNIYGKVYNLGVTGSINVSNTTYASGFARCVRGTGIVVNCYSNVNVTANTGAAGFTTSNYGKIYNCYYSGTLNGKNNYGFAQTVSNGVSGTCYYTMGTDPKASATAITEEEAKTTLAGLLNDGRSDAAAAIGLNESNLYYWYSNNSLPVLVAEEPKPVDIITGTGTADDPYIINSASDFITFTEAMNGGETYSDKYFKQTENIDLAGTTYPGAATKTTASATSYFRGIYNGNGKTINLALTSADERSLFPYVEGKIYNLASTGSITLTGGSYTAGFVRSLRANGVLANCYSTIAFKFDTGSASGLVASRYGNIYNCYFAGSLDAKYEYGLVHSVSGGSTTNCYYTVGNDQATPVGTKVTEEEAKTTLAGLLNDGRSDAATGLGVAQSELMYWTSDNSLPAFTTEAPAEPEPDEPDEPDEPEEDTGITGTGTAEDPYIINSANDFITFSDAVTGGEQYKNTYFKQTENIDLAGNANYTGITSSNSFYGYYDGQGHTINVALTTTADKNIFPYVYGTIINLGITGSLNMGGTYAGGVARAIRDGGKLINSYSTVDLTSTNTVAGLCGSGYGTIANCYFAGTLNSTSKYAIAAAGKATAVYSNCYATSGKLADYVEATTITDEDAKTTLASSLNSGRSDAATASGIAEASLFYWTSDNSLPTLVAELPTEPEPDEPEDTGITGTGTKEDPYIINSAGDFIIFTNALNEGETYSGKYFNQTENIDLAGNENYVGALSSGAFYGYYDGLGHTINVALTATDERNIFPYFYKTIMNLGTTGTMNITGANYTAGITRSVRTGAVLANCYSTMTINANAAVGGLCASGNGTLVNCYFAGTLNSSTGNNKAIAISSSGATFKNCYYTTGALAENVIATKVTEAEAKTILAALLNETRQDAADAANVDRSKISFWTNSNGYPKHFIPSYTDITAEVSNPLIQAGKSESSVITTTADYVSSWKVTNINSDATYTVSDDKKTLTITSGNKAGKVIATAYSEDGILISDEIVVTVHSSKVSVPGLNMINGLDTVVDFEDGLGYGLKTRSTNIYYTTADVPTIDYSANKDANGNSVAALENATGKAIVTDGSNMHKGDAWYFYLGTQITTLESGREYSAYAQVYANPDPAQKSAAYFNNFRTSNGLAAMTVSHNSQTNSWREYSYTGTYDKNTSDAVAFNTRQENLVTENDVTNDSTITVAAFDNAYIIPHYKVTYHLPDGTSEVSYFNPIETTYPLTFKKAFTPDKTYTSGYYTDANTGNEVYYSGKWATSENGSAISTVMLENYDIDLYPEAVESPVYYVDSLESITLTFAENAYVTDTYSAATVTGNGTTEITIAGKGYNGKLTVKSAEDKLLADIYLTGTHKWRPGLNIFTGTLESFDIETDPLFETSTRAYISENPIIDEENDTSKVLKISDSTAYFGAKINFESPIDLNRVMLVEYDVTGQINGYYWNLANTYNSDGKIETISAPDPTKWTRYSKAISGKGLVDATKHSEINSFNFQVQGKAGEELALYVDNISIIPSYRIEFFDQMGNKIDNFYYPRKKELTEYFYSTHEITIDYNNNTHYIVNGLNVETNGKYKLNYEDLLVTVIPNSDAVMFSGQNATTVVPEGTTYVIPYPHELPGFTADYFITWKTADGDVLAPGTTVNTSDITGTTIYAYCDESAFTRTPVNGAVVNFASEQYNNWLANYHRFSVLSRSDGTYEKERGVVFNWEAENNASSYEVLYSTNKDMSDAVTLEADGTTATAHYLFAATDYYWQVKTTYKDGTTGLSDIWMFTTADIHRLIKEIGNMRDAGGRLTEDGRYRVKQGIMYRGQSVHAGNRATTDQFGIIADLDLRGAETGWITSSPLGDDIKFKIVEGTHYYSNETSPKHYANPAGQAVFAEEVRFFADASNFPLYFHCAGGRDRTGMLAYIIGGILGVPEDILFRDYELTYLSGSSVGDEESATLLNWMDGFTDYVNENFEGDTFQERMVGYVKLCGVTDEEITQIRANLLEEVPITMYKTLDTASIRTTNPQGIRYACYVDVDTGTEADEYGFVVAAKSKLLEAYPDDSSFENLVLNSNGDKSGVLSDGTTKYSASAAYIKDSFDQSEFLTIEEAKNTFPEKALESIVADGYYFTVALINIPESHYKDAIVGRPYVKINGEYVYGEAVAKSIYEVAKELSAKENLDDEVRKVVNSIIEKCEKDIYLDYGNLTKQ